MDFDQPPVVRVPAEPDGGLAPGAWPMTVPAVAQLMAEGLELVQHWKRYLDAPGAVPEPRARLRVAQHGGGVTASYG